MVIVLHEIERHNVVWFYLREQFYEGGIVKEKHLTPAKLKDVADVLKPSLVTSRRILQIVGAWVGIGNLLVSLSDLSEVRKHEYYTNIINGAVWSTGFAALHARICGLDTGDVINKLYLDAFRLTVSDLKIETMRAFGIPLADETVNEAITVSPVKMDDKGRVTIPKFVRALFDWRPGNNLQPKINIEKEEITCSLVKSKRTSRVPVDLCEGFLQIPEYFFHVCMKINPLTDDELGKALDEDLSMLSILSKDTPEIASLLRQLLVEKKNSKAK